MNIPNIKHPLKFTFKGVAFQVISFDKLTDAQAEIVVKNYLRMNKVTAKKGALVGIVYTGQGA